MACDALARWDGWVASIRPRSAASFNAPVRGSRTGAKQRKLEPDPILDRATLYDLRHTIGATIYSMSGDIHATQQYLDHCRPRHNSPLCHQRRDTAVDDERSAQLEKGPGRRQESRSPSARDSPA